MPATTLQAPRPFVRGAARGLAYGEIPEEIAARLEGWVADGGVEGEELAPGRVWRLGPWVVKRSSAPRGLRRLRRPLAIRAAEQARRLAPIRAPVPLVAVALGRGLRRGPSLLVMEYIEGRPLHELWDQAPEAVDAFPAFLAALHRRRLFHGDLHPGNSLWNGRDWVLIDLESMRHGLHGLRPTRLIEAQWARLLSNTTRIDPRVAPRVRRLFELYLDEAGRGWNADLMWGRIEKRAGERAKMLAKKYAAP